ncbi:MAG: integrase [endosymbiont of Galathealinum brachiosum]|uniref:Integrase n=1 Tax=endosymbiont of Galathealinum brachiosum TaxID=2200906 RepID=A0A370DC71_9GAMM|nr:MAG: integrase [endosymbiont of Galathealinum brachiosum]
MKIKLTQSVVNNYQIPDHITARQLELVDDGGTGLYLLVTQTGFKTFYLRYRSSANGGKSTHVKLGRATDITLAQARDKVKKLRAEIALGDDPQTKIKKQRNEITYGEFMKEYYFPHINSRIRSAKTYRQMFDTQIAKAFGDIKVNQITKRQVHAFHNDLRSKGLKNGTCNRYLQLIKSSINFGISMEIISIRNPAVGIPLFEEISRERYLDPDELARLLPVLIKDDSQIAKIIRYLLATGLRLGECLNCEWKHINIDKKVMMIPSARSKSKKAASIPLNDAAIQVLEECDKSTVYPFINLNTGKPYVMIKKSFQKLMKQAELEGVTAHVLRHTAASMMINAGRSLYDVQKVLRHSSSIVTEKYSHLSQQSVMDASDTISEQLFKAASGNQG